ncbi:plasmid pRiA4b ORF-3 family protein [Streptomyces sviceus]|uniref:plasmid pRiA4b ORF-3 family protein n=1 Tax=Streptomyces sviceus TaxID=285530 RepID=UPI0036F0BC0D
MASGTTPGTGRGPIRLRIYRPDGELGFCDERTATLTALLKLGAHWGHLVAMEQFQTASAGLHYPHCVDGAGACPPEDFGGAPGYSDLKVILAGPAHEEHHAMLVWLGLRSATESPLTVSRRTRPTRGCCA